MNLSSAYYVMTPCMLKYTAEIEVEDDKNNGNSFVAGGQFYDSEVAG